MNVGRFTIEPLNEGQFELFPDGKINRTPVSETDTQKSAITGKRSLAGINPLYVTDGSRHLLLDAGLGWGLDAGSGNKNVSNIRTNLDIFGVEPADITHVNLSHLHYDHAAGISYTDEESSTRAVFPNAACYLQQSEWDYALREAQSDEPSSAGSHSAYYKLDDLYRLHADSYFTFIDEAEKEIIPGVSLLKTGGHTPGHQVVKITADDKTGSQTSEHRILKTSEQANAAYYMGDLVPAPAQLNHIEAGTHPANRMQAKKMKIRLLRKAHRENALLYFYHSLSAKGGRLKMDKEKKFIFEEI